MFMHNVTVNAYCGSLVADAFSMPVHWYYDCDQMDRDYGELVDYTQPLALHPDSILWRSKYRARNKRGEILHDQARYWGQGGVHYHQFLPKGGNTLNFQLSAELLCSVLVQGQYSTEAWLQHYVSCLRQPGWHKDTYIEEWHRGFFDNYARRVPIINCGVKDLHIGGLSSVPALLCAMALLKPDESEASLTATVVQHLSATYRHQQVLSAAESLCRILLAIRGGARIRDAIQQHAQQWGIVEQFEMWSAWEDRTVVGKAVSRACYLPESYSASLYLAYKYADDFSAGILANAHCGGDNCHRGAVVGSILAAEHGVESPWIKGLQNRTVLRSLELCETHLLHK